MAMKVKGMKAMKAMKAMKEKPMKAMKAMKAEKAEKHHFVATKAAPEKVAAREEIAKKLKKLHNALNPGRHPKGIPPATRVRLEAERDRLKRDRDALNNPPADPIGALLEDLMKE